MGLLPYGADINDTLVEKSYVNISLLVPIDSHVHGAFVPPDGDAGGEAGPCVGNWNPANHAVYQAAHAVLLVGMMLPHSIRCLLLMHTLLALGFLLMSCWAWALLCAPDIFSWKFSFFFINFIQVLFLAYQLRPIRFPPELEDVYASLFLPMKVNRNLFKRLVSSEICEIHTLHQGEAYATQEVTKTDRLALLINGTAHVSCNGQFLHYIQEKQFLDSPEFESTTHGEEKFHVSISAGLPLRFVVWQRQSLEYLFAKEPRLATVMGHVLGRDITNKLYLLNEKLKIQNGRRVDIRLPNVSCAALSGVDLRMDDRNEMCVDDLHSMSDGDESEDQQEISEKMPMFPNGVTHNKLQLQLSNSTYSSLSSH